MQTFLYGKMGRVKVPQPKGERHSVVMRDGATMTFDIFKPLGEKGKFFEFTNNYSPFLSFNFFCF